MTSYSIKDITSSVDRYKIYILMSKLDGLTESIQFIHSESISTINIGKELATYIDSLEDYKYLYIDVYDYTKKLLDQNKTKINGSGSDVVAIYNFGILLEPSLKLNSVQLFKEFSKSSALIIIWENELELPNRLKWSTQKDNFFLDFSDTQLKKIHYEI
jgi:hypothetical protein